MVVIRQETIHLTQFTLRIQFRRLEYGTAYKSRYRPKRKKTKKNMMAEAFRNPIQKENQRK